VPRRLPPACVAGIATVVLALAAAVRAAPAQIVAGETVEETTGAPLVGLLVRLVRGDGGVRVVDSARTDERGLFQFTPGAPGVYHVEFAPRAALGASPADTVSGDTTVARRYSLPVVRLAAARPFLKFQVDEPADKLSGARGRPRYPERFLPDGVERVVVAAYVRRIEGEGRPAVPPHVARWIDRLGASKPVVAIALGNPYLVRQFPSVGTYMVTYGVGDALERAAARAALGRASITGKTPVSLPGFFARGDGIRR